LTLSKGVLCRYEEQSRSRMAASHLASILFLALLLLGALSPLAPVAMGQGNAVAVWATPGAFLDYTVSGSFNLNLKLGNGSSGVVTGSVSGSLRLTVNSVSNGYARITSVPNLAFQESVTNFNGTVETYHSIETPANGTTTQNYPLTQLDFGMLTQQVLSQANSLFNFSPTSNGTISQAPGVLYQWKGTNVPALHITLNLNQQSSFPGFQGESVSYSTSGIANIYLSMGQEIPLEVSGNAQGSGSGSNVQLGANQVQNFTASGSAQLSILLDSTNVNLGQANAQQATVQIPAYSASLYVLSNSTLNGVSTTGNKLEIDVTGPTGTSGVVQVIVSQTILSRAGISDPSQVGITLDGQPYTDYSVTQIAGTYIFTIYYHHSSHTIALAFGNANFGTNQGTVSQLGAVAGGTVGASIWIYLVVVVVAAVVVAVVGLVFWSRSKRRALPTGETSSVASSSTPTVAQCIT